MIHCLVFAVVLAAEPVSFVAAPDLQGEPLQRARQLVELRGLHFAEGVYFISPSNWRSDIETGKTYLQYPRPKAAIPNGAELAAWRFQKADEQQALLETPDYVGQTWEKVLESLSKSQLQGMNDKAFLEKDDIVTDQYPRAGTKVYLGTSIFFAGQKTNSP